MILPQWFSMQGEMNKYSVYMREPGCGERDDHLQCSHKVWEEWSLCRAYRSRGACCTTQSKANETPVASGLSPEREVTRPGSCPWPSRRSNAWRTGAAWQPTRRPATEPGS